MKKILISCLLYSLSALVLGAQERISLNGDWYFSYAPDKPAADSLMNLFQADSFSFDRNRFDQIKVPSNWAVLGYEEPVYRGFKDNKF